MEPTVGGARAALGALALLVCGCAVSADAPDGAPDATWSASTTTTVRVHYDAGFGHRIAIRGSAAPLSWSAGHDAIWTSGNIWVHAWRAAGDVELKPLIDDAQW